jgi:hypothetical protein
MTPRRIADPYRSSELWHRAGTQILTDLLSNDIVQDRRYFPISWVMTSCRITDSCQSSKLWLPVRSMIVTNVYQGKARRMLFPILRWMFLRNTSSQLRTLYGTAPSGWCLRVYSPWAPIMAGYTYDVLDGQWLTQQDMLMQLFRKSRSVFWTGKRWTNDPILVSFLTCKPENKNNYNFLWFQYPVPTQTEIVIIYLIFIYRWPLLWSSGRSSWLQILRFGFDYRRYHIFWEVVGLEGGPLSHVSTIEELLRRKSSGSGLESRKYGRRNPSRGPRSIFYQQKLALTSPASSGRSNGIVSWRTRTTEHQFFFIYRKGTNIARSGSRVFGHGAEPKRNAAAKWRPWPGSRENATQYDLTRSLPISAAERSTHKTAARAIGVHYSWRRNNLHPVSPNYTLRSAVWTRRTPIT